MKRTMTKHTGVYERVSSSKMHNGKADRCFDIAYKSDGKKVWEKIGWLSEGYTAKLASEIRAERLRSIRHGEELPKQKKKAPYLKDVAQKYFEWAETNKKQHGKDDRHRYKNHLIKFEDRRLNEISSFDLERWKSDLIKSGYAPATVKHCLVLMRQMFNKAVMWGMYQGQNPVKGVKIPSVQNQRERFLSYEEADTLLNKLLGTSIQLYTIALISLQTGMRAGEIFTLRGQDLDFQNDLINVSDPKNKAARKIFMTGKVKEMLLQFVPEVPKDYIFKNKKGGRITEIPKSFRRAVDELKFNEGIDDPRQRITFHSLRHTFASWLALQGEQIQVIQELLGHRTLAMTTRYSHLMPDQKRRATLNLEKAFNGKRNGTVITMQEGV